MAGRRRRGLSPEERALWNQVAARTTPLRPPDAPVAAELDEVRKAARVWTVFDGEMSGARVAEMLDSTTKRR